jgi:hypothetical protein
MLGNSKVAAQLAASQEGLSSMELVISHRCKNLKSIINTLHFIICVGLHDDLLRVHQML